MIKRFLQTLLFAMFIFAVAQSEVSASTSLNVCIVNRTNTDIVGVYCTVSASSYGGKHIPWGKNLLHSPIRSGETMDFLFKRNDPKRYLDFKIVLNNGDTKYRYGAKTLEKITMNVTNDGIISS